MLQTTTKCYNCYTPLGIYDLKNSKWHDDVEEFIFICPSCGKENKIMSNLLSEGHIAMNYLSLFKENKDYLPEQQQSIIFGHLTSCNICKNILNDLLLNEVEEKATFNAESIRYFNNHGFDVMQNVTSEVKVEGRRNIREFCLNGKVHNLTDECEVCREPFFLDEKKTQAERIIYFLMDEFLLLGMVSFVFCNDEIVLEKVWIKPEEMVKDERQLIDDFKNHRLNVSLSVLKAKRVNLS
jgi:hypothetical protein